MDSTWTELAGKPVGTKSKWIKVMSQLYPLLVFWFCKTHMTCLASSVVEGKPLFTLPQNVLLSLKKESHTWNYFNFFWDFEHDIYLSLNFKS